MSIHSSSKPHSVAYTLSSERSGAAGKRLTQDALYVCQLLAIHPEDLLQRDLDSFAEKGLSAKRQQLRFEHYEEKRHLKLKAIQNVLLKCQQKDSGEAAQVQALIEDLKRQRIVSSPNQQNQYSPFGSKKYNTQDENNSVMNMTQTGKASQFIDNLASQQMERVLSKLDKWTKTKEITDKIKQDQNQRMQQLLLKEKKKFDKIEKNLKERQEDLQERLQYQKHKWETRINQRADIEKKEEQKKLQRVRELMSDQEKFLKSQRELSFQERRRNDTFNHHNASSFHDNSIDKINSSAPAVGNNNYNQKEEDTVDLELKKLQEKLRRAEERHRQNTQSVVSRGMNHSMLIQERKTLAEEQFKQRQQELLSKTVKKAMRTKSKQDSRQEELMRNAGKLQEIHKQKEMKLKRQQEEERRAVKEQLQMLSRKDQQKEQILKQKRDELMDHISGKKEKRKLQFEDKAENEKRLKLIQMNLKQQIFEKHQERERKVNEKRSQWFSQ